MIAFKKQKKRAWKRQIVNLLVGVVNFEPVQDIIAFLQRIITKLESFKRNALSKGQGIESNSILSTSSLSTSLSSLETTTTTPSTTSILTPSSSSSNPILNNPGAWPHLVPQTAQPPTRPNLVGPGYGNGGIVGNIVTRPPPATSSSTTSPDIIYGWPFNHHQTTPNYSTKGISPFVFSSSSTARTPTLSYAEAAALHNADRHHHHDHTHSPYGFSGHNADGHHHHNHNHDLDNTSSHNRNKHHHHHHTHRRSYRV